MPSILLGRRVFVERLQDGVEAGGLAADVETLLSDPGERESAARASEELHALLSVGEGPARFADLVASGSA
jgi:lipid A disaccharide synthetase